MEDNGEVKRTTGPPYTTTMAEQRQNFKLKFIQLQGPGSAAPIAIIIIHVGAWAAGSSRSSCSWASSR